jgi:succinate dehydrogenase / fumarate reductase, membrane anchor subunit
MGTPLGKVRGLGSAKTGTGHFIRQRLTGIANIPLVGAFVVIVAALAGRPHAEVVAAVGHPLVSLILIAAILSVTIHMRIGMQVIIEDYVHAELPRIALLIGNTLFSLAIGLISVFAILSIAFGA